MLKNNHWEVMQNIYCALAVFGILLVFASITPSWGMFEEEENKKIPTVASSPQPPSLITNTEPENNHFTLSELDKRFYLVHKTKKVPEELTLHPAGISINEPFAHDFQRPTCPFTIHWSAFSDLEWTNGNYNVAIIAPFVKLKNQILIFSLKEIVTIGPYPLGAEDSILVPDDVPVTHIWNAPSNSLSKIIPYPHTQNVGEAIQTYFQLKGFFQIKKASDNEEECEWSEECGIIDKGPPVTPALFGKSFLDTYPYVSLGSEGDIKTGNWWRIAVANHYPYLVAETLKESEQPYRFKKWFFEIYERNNQKLIQMLKKYALPHIDFAQKLSKDVLEFVNTLADLELTESKPSKKVFKTALDGFYGWDKGKTIYKALRDSRGESEVLTTEMRSEFLKVWTIVYPLWDPSSIKNIIKSKAK